MLVDGHYSREVAEIWKLAEEADVYGFFLKSDDSIRDQISDCGPNSMIRQCNQVWSRFVLRTGGTVDPSCAAFNQAMVQVWDLLRIKLVECCLKAAIKTGWVWQQVKDEATDEYVWRPLDHDADNYKKRHCTG